MPVCLLGARRWFARLLLLRRAARCAKLAANFVSDVVVVVVAAVVVVACVLRGLSNPRSCASGSFARVAPLGAANALRVARTTRSTGRHLLRATQQTQLQLCL